MVLAEVLVEMDNLKRKIGQLDKYLKTVTGSDQKLEDKIITMLLDLLDKYRSHLILVNRVNNDVEVFIGDTKTSLANAVIIADTIERKIDILNSLIDNKDVAFDLFDLINNRNKLLDEHTTIKNSLRKTEWKVKVD
jgi:hypothetical protein